MEERVTVPILFAIPHGWQDLARALCFRNGGNYMSGREALVDMRAEPVPGEDPDLGRMLRVDIQVDVPWTDAQRLAFGDHLLELVRVQLGIPWLGTQAVLQYVEAERAVKAAGDPTLNTMFASLRTTDPRGWPEPLLDMIEQAKKLPGKVVEKAVDKVAETGVAAVMNPSTVINLLLLWRVLMARPDGP